MRATNNPRLVILIVIVIFAVMLAVALYSPAYVTTGSTQNSSALTVVPVSFSHVINPLNSTQSTIPSQNYTSLFYVQRVCTYHQ